jgi:hypothetical protein
MAAPQGPPNRREGELPRATYSQITANATSETGISGRHLKRLPKCASSFWQRAPSKTATWTSIQAKEKVAARGSAPWVPGKCIPQAPQAPKYVVCSPRIEEQKQYMRDNALVGKFLGLWPSERDLVKWIQYWWKPKGHYDLQLGSKGFFTIIFHNLEDRNRSLRWGAILL